MTIDRVLAFPERIAVFKHRSLGISQVGFAALGSGWIDQYFYGEKAQYRKLLNDSGLVNHWRGQFEKKT